MRWSQAELREARDVAESNHVATYGPAGVRAFIQLYAETEPIVHSALRKTKDLTSLDRAALEADRDIWQTLRFFCAPPVSEENLWTFVGKKFSGSLPNGLEAKMAEILVSTIDPVRFPWIAAERAPTKSERHAAVMSTTMMMTQAQFHTMNRGITSQTQEAAVHSILESAGFTLDHGAKTPMDLKPGTFCKEKVLFNKKCDVPVRLHDNRLLTLECKVSNTPKNSWKRLNQEAVGKSAHWREHLGDGVVTGCVLAGVFDTACLVQAQDQGIMIFWQHDLSSLVRFVKAT